MPYDEDGNWIDPEEDQLDSEGSPQFDMGEYLRRANLQGAVASGPVATAEPKIFQAPAIGPEESKYRQMQSQTPLKENFRPSGLRKALGFIGGAVSGNPDVREGITDYAYRKAQGDFQQKLGVQGSKATQEEADVARAAVQGHLGAQSAAELARRQAEISRGGYYDWRSSPTAHQYKMEELGVQHKTTAEEGPYEAKLKDGSTVDLVRTPSGLWKNPENGTIISREAIDQISEKGKSIKTSNQFTGVLAEDVAAHKVVSEETAKPGTHDPAVVEAAKAYIKNREQGKDPTNAYADVVRTMEEGGKKLTADQKIKIAHAVQPEQKPPQVAVVDPSTNQVINAKPGVVLPPGARTVTEQGQMNTPTAATRGRGEAAQTAIRAGDDVIAFANQNRQGLGNLGNYWKELISGTPAADPTVAAFQGRVASWAAFQAAAHGFRASTVMREFEDRIGKGPKNVDSVIAVVDGINKELQHAVETGHGTSGPINVPGPKATKRYNPATGKIEAIQ